MLVPTGKMEVTVRHRFNSEPAGTFAELVAWADATARHADPLVIDTRMWVAEDRQSGAVAMAYHGQYQLHVIDTKE